MKNLSSSIKFCCGLLILVPALNACNTLSPKPQTVPQTPPAIPVTPPPVPKPISVSSIQPMPAETMHDLILAEQYIDQGHPEAAIPYYVEEATATQNPEILERAIQLCVATKNHAIALRLANIWVHRDPDNINAQSSMASSLWHLGHYQQAVVYLSTVLKKDPNAQFAELVLSQPSRSAVEDQRIDSALRQLIKTLPTNVNVQYTYAFWLAHGKKFDSALKLCMDAERLSPDFIPAQLLHAQLLEFTQHNHQALTYLNAHMQHEPINDELLQNKAALLIRLGQNQEAEKDYLILTQHFPKNGDYLLAHALLAMQNHHDEAAKQSLKLMQSIESRKNDANFYLGQINASQHHSTEALQDFNAITPGPDFLPAQQAAASLRESNQQFSEAAKDLDNAMQKYPKYLLPLALIKADLLSDHQQYDDAAHILDQLMKTHPEDTDVLYARAMVAVQQNDLKLFETDIRKILDKKPNNPVALNALGYTLADRTQRYQEAKTDIEQALKLSPNDPAIIDSMGWVEFRLGDKITARTYLEKAWNMEHDDEIGSHYGELLWLSGQKDQAEKVWNEALRLHPHSPFISVTRHRLGAP